jgi:hypothetical protein
MDEVVSHRRSRFRLFGFWERYRVRKNQKLIEMLSDPGNQEVQTAKQAIRETKAEAQLETMKMTVL